LNRFIRFVRKKDAAVDLRAFRLLSILLMFSISFWLVDALHGAQEADDTIGDARKEIYEAIDAVTEAYNSGGEVSELIGTLNEALSLIGKAETPSDANLEEVIRLSSQVQTIAQTVRSNARYIKEEGERRRQVETVTTIGSLVSLFVSGAFVYIYGPKLFWRTWVRLRKDYRVSLKGSNQKSVSSMLTSGEVWALAFVMILIGTVLVSSQLFFPRSVAEPFSELGVLGARMNMADYPKEVVASESFKLNLYVGNHMGRPVDYIVMVKLGSNETSVDPAQIEPIVKFEKVLLDNETWIFPIDIKLIETGLNQRIIFELWTYNELSRRIEYNQRWCQIWVNVTAPF